MEGAALINAGTSDRRSITDQDGCKHSVDPETSKEKLSKEVKIMALNDTKAGMEGLDVDKINQIIQTASQGSKFYLHKQKSQEKLDKRVQELQAQMKALSEAQIMKAEKQVDTIAKRMEERRNLSSVIVHIDMDMFFAAVELRDRPSLRNKPMAVGGYSMLSTSNYVARRFGVRAAMPGFIAKKLCPELVIVKPNYEKYTAVSEEVQNILREYDPDFSAMSLDEAYLDITTYLFEKNTLLSEGSQITPLEVVKELRQKIFDKTELTASAGIAPNGLLAKICGDICKPNNQYYLEPTREAVMAFISSLHIRKIGGIGAVTEQLLKGIGVNTVSDLWDKRGIIDILFKPATASFLLGVSMGLGGQVQAFASSSNSKDDSSEDRKSISCERTFSGTSDLNKLKEMCHKLSQNLQEDLESKCILAKAVSVKIKTVDFDVKTRIRNLADYTSQADVIFDTAWSIYQSYVSEIPNLCLRLFGVRVSNLKFPQGDSSSENSTDKVPKQHRIDKLFKKLDEAHAEQNDGTSQFQCPICCLLFKSERDVSAHVDNCDKSSIDKNNETDCTVMKEDNPVPCSSRSLVEHLQDTDSTDTSNKLICPICNCYIQCKPHLDVALIESTISNHVDECLNKMAVKEMLDSEVGVSKRTFSKDNSVEGNPRKKRKGQMMPIDSYFKRSA